MAELNLDYYTAKDHYSDGDIEETLLKMAQEGKSFEDLSFTVAGTSVTLTGLAIAALAGILLNAVLPGKDYVFDAAPAEDRADSVFQQA